MFIPINTNSTTLTSTLTAMLGYQGWTQFNINLGQGGIATWASNCTNNGTGASCSASPFYTNNYFSSQWVANYESYNQYFDGYNTTGYLLGS